MYNRVLIMDKTRSVTIITKNIRKQHLENLARGKGMNGEVIMCISRDGIGKFINMNIK